MYQFTCASPVCHTRLSAPTKDEVMAKVAQHFAVRHRVPNPSRSIVEFVEANAIKQVAS